MNNVQLVNAVNAKEISQISLTEAKTTGHNVAPGSTSGHYAVKCKDMQTVNADNRQFILTPVAGEIGLITEKHGEIAIQTTNKVGVFCQNEFNPFINATQKSRD